MANFRSWFERSADEPETGPDGSNRDAESSTTEAVASEVRVEHVVAALRQVYDPEIPVNIYDLGLIYRVDIQGDGFVEIDMTLTAPGCPVAQEFPGMVEHAVCQVPGIDRAHVEIVWDPPWSPDRMSEEAKLELGML